jgi:HEPN domain-containing protein
MKSPGAMTVRGEGATVNQAELRQMSKERIRDAQALIRGKRWEFAYYSAGYAVECALKSCLLARMVATGWVFDPKAKTTDQCRTHEFLALIRTAGLEEELNAKLKESGAAGREFVDNWEIVNQWRVTSRYEAKTEDEARKLLAAITDKPHGVLKWIQNYW